MKRKSGIITKRFRKLQNEYIACVFPEFKHLKGKGKAMEEECHCIACRVSRMADEEGIEDYVFFAHDGENTYTILSTENYRPGCLVRICLDEIAEEDPELVEEIRDGLQAKPDLKTVH